MSDIFVRRHFLSLRRTRSTPRSGRASLDLELFTKP